MLILIKKGGKKLFSLDNDEDSEEFFNIMYIMLEDEEKLLDCQIYPDEELFSPTKSILKDYSRCTKDECDYEFYNDKSTSIIHLSPASQPKDQKMCDVIGNRKEEQDENVNKIQLDHLDSFEAMIDEYFQTVGLDESGVGDSNYEQCNHISKGNPDKIPITKSLLKSQIIVNLGSQLIFIFPGFDEEERTSCDVYREKYTMRVGNYNKLYIPWSFICCILSDQGAPHFVAISRCLNKDGGYLNTWFLFDDERTDRGVSMQDPKIKSYVSLSVMILLVHEDIANFNKGHTGSIKSQESTVKSPGIPVNLTDEKIIDVDAASLTPTGSRIKPVIVTDSLEKPKSRDIVGEDTKYLFKAIWDKFSLCQYYFCTIDDNIPL